MNHDFFMHKALVLAKQAAEHDEVPVGAVVVLNGEIIGEGFNQPITGCDPTAHAEMVALRQAAKHIGNYRLNEATLYVTIEPCMMCAGAIVHARIKEVVFGAVEPKAGAVVSTQQAFDLGNLNHKVSYVGGVLSDACSQIISDFFKIKRTRV